MALVLPSLPGITWPRDLSTGNFDTTIQTTVSGKSNYYPNRINPTRRYTLRISALDSSGARAEILARSKQTLEGFFNQCYGRALPFQYTDPDDCSVTAQSFGTGDGTTTAFQLVRMLGGFTELVYAPTGTPQIFVGGTLKTAGTDYSLNANTGGIVFTVAPAASAALTWTGSFNWWCNWDAETLDLSQLFAGVYEVQKASFTSRIF